MKVRFPLTWLIQAYIPLPYTFNVKNTSQLINDLNDIPYNQNLRLASFDITNMYTNIRTSDLIAIIDTACRNNHIEENLTQEILKLSGVIINQNFFHVIEKTCLQSEGLAVGAPSSSIFSEFYLQFLEISKIYILLQSHNILGYFCYVDDIQWK